MPHVGQGASGSIGARRSLVRFDLGARSGPRGQRLRSIGFEAALVPDAGQLFQLVEDITAVIVADRFYDGALAGTPKLIVLHRIVQPPSSLKIL